MELLALHVGFPRQCSVETPAAVTAQRVATTLERVRRDPRALPDVLRSTAGMRCGRVLTDRPV